MTALTDQLIADEEDHDARIIAAVTEIEAALDAIEHRHGHAIVEDAFELLFQRMMARHMGQVN